MRDDREPAALLYGLLWAIEVAVLVGALDFLLSGASGSGVGAFTLLIGIVGSGLLLFYNVERYLTRMLEYHGLTE